MSQEIDWTFGGTWPFEPRYFDTPEGWIESGEVIVLFDWDGSSDPTQIIISDPDSRSIDLDVAPILDTVRISEES